MIAEWLQGQVSLFGLLLPCGMTQGKSLHPLWVLVSILDSISAPVTIPHRYHFPRYSLSPPHQDFSTLTLLAFGAGESFECPLNWKLLTASIFGLQTPAILSYPTPHPTLQMCQPKLSPDIAPNVPGGRIATLGTTGLYIGAGSGYSRSLISQTS